MATVLPFRSDSVRSGKRKAARSDFSPRPAADVGQKVIPLFPALLGLFDEQTDPSGKHSEAAPEQALELLERAIDLLHQAHPYDQRVLWLLEDCARRVACPSAE